MMTINHSSADQRTMRIISELNQRLVRAEQLVEELCHLIPDGSVDEDGSVEGIIVKYFTEQTAELDNLRRVMRAVATSAFTPRQCREPLLEALDEDEDEDDG